MLTTSTDTIEGTADADALTGVVSALSTENTFNVLDVIDGGAGEDVANISIGANFAGFTANKGSMTNVETVNLTNTSAVSREFDATGVTGVTKYSIDASSAAVTLKDIDALVALEVKGQAEGKMTLAYDTASTVVTSTTATDVQSLKLTDVGTKNTSTTATSNAKHVDFTVAKVETLNVDSQGTGNYVDLTNVADAKTITVKGSAITDIKDVGSAVTSFDSSAATGNVKVDLDNAAAGKLATVKTGSGDDSVTATYGDLAAGATIDMGTGADKLILAGAGSTIQPTITGVETIDVNGLTGTSGQLSMKNSSGLTDITIDGTVAAMASAASASFLYTTGNIAITATGAQDQGTDAIIGVDTTGTVTVNTNATAASITAATAAQANAMQFDANKASSVALNVGQGVNFTGKVNAAEATSLTIDAASLKTSAGTELSVLGAATITAAKATTVTLNSAATVTNTELFVAKAATVNITTSATTDATLEVEAAVATTLNVTATGNLTFAAAAGGAVGTALNKAQNITINTTKVVDFDTNNVTMNAAANVTVGGTATTSKVDFQNLGNSALDYNMTINASGLKAGLETGIIDAGVGSLAFNAANVTGAITTGTIDADNAVNLDFKNVGGAIAVGIITGKSVTIDAEDATQGIVFNSVAATDGADEITATTAVTIKGSYLQNNIADIGTTATSTAFTATLSGGIGNDKYRIDGNGAQTSIVVSGNLGSGTDVVDVNLANSSATTGQTVDLSGLTSTTSTSAVSLSAETDDVALTFKGSAGNDTVSYVTSTATPSFTKDVSITDSSTTDSDILSFDTVSGNDDLSFTKLAISGIEVINIKSNGTDTLTINASAISGDTFKLDGAVASQILYTTGTDAADVIDFTNITDGTTAASIVVTAGKLNDSIKLGAVKSTVVFADTADNNGVDIITGFTAGTDKINVDAFGTATGTTAVTGSLGNIANTVYLLAGQAAGSADSLASAAAAITAAATWATASVTSNIIIVDDNSTSIYEWVEAGTNGAQASELTLMGTIDAVLVAGTDIVFA